MSRFRIIGLLAVLAVLATALGACGGGDDPAAVLDSASLEGLESGKLDFSLSTESGGESLDVSLSGPFQRRGKDLPLLDLGVTAKGTAGGEPVDFEAGLTLLADRGFVDYEGVVYEIDPANFRLTKASFLPLDPSRKAAKVSALSACQEAVAALDLTDFVDDLSDDGSAEVDGTETTKISGDLDLPAALDAFVALAKRPSCGAQLEAAGRSVAEVEQAAAGLSGVEKAAHVEIYVGDDDIVRKVAGELTAAPGGGGDEARAEFELTLSEVNEGPEITAPATGKSILQWFQKLGVSPFEALFLVSDPEGLGRVLELIAADAFPAAAG